MQVSIRTTGDAGHNGPNGAGGHAAGPDGDGENGSGAGGYSDDYGTGGPGGILGNDATGGLIVIRYEGGDVVSTLKLPCRNSIGIGIGI
jgi:hypothetical protein